MAENFKYTAGLNNVGSFQVSGMPFVSGSINCKAGGTGEQVVKFPYVTKWVMVRNNDGSELRVGFSQLGVINDNYYSLPAFNAAGGTGNVKFDIKCTEIWISGSQNVDVMAGLTNIPVERVRNISVSGSNWSGSYDAFGAENVIWATDGVLGKGYGIG